MGVYRLVCRIHAPHAVGNRVARRAQRSLFYQHHIARGERIIGASSTMSRRSATAHRSPMRPLAERPRCEGLFFGASLALSDWAHGTR